MSKPAASWSVRLPALPLPELSLNRYLGYKGHWTRAEWRDTQRDAWLMLLSQADRQNFGVDLLGIRLRPFIYPVSIAIRLMGTGRKTDVPNWTCHYGLKVLVDCLTEPMPSVKKYFGLVIIKNDVMRYVSAYTVTVDPDGEPSTEVSITKAKEAT